MRHRSVPPPDHDPDPFWQAAERVRPPVLARLGQAAGPLRSWVLVAVGLVAVAAVGWWLLRPAAPPIESALPSAASPAATSGPSPGGTAASTVPAGTATSAPPVLLVQAAGAVAEPGVYSLDAGARVADLVEAAGGLSADADADRVNLAAPVADGERIWLPRRGEDQPPDVVAGGSGGSGVTPGTTGGSGSAGAPVPDQPVDLNRATAQELDALPGVGPATASAILAFRDERGGFRSVDDLLDVRGIGEAKLEQLRPLVRV